MHRFAALSFLAWLGMLSPAVVAAPDHPIVPGFERFSTGEKADIARGGQLLLGELNCVSCHKAADSSLVGKQAPILDFLTTRTRIGYLRKFLRDPHGVKPGTTMPALFAGDPARDQKVEALLHFLASTGSLRQERPSMKGVGSGRDLYQKVGCVACHGSRDATGNADKVTATSVPLGDLKEKYSIAGLAAFLENPQHVRPSGRMPKLLTSQEARDVANYLLQGARIELASGKGATNYSYYEGSWDRVPDFGKMKPKTTGTAIGFDVGVARRGDNFALKFEGVFKIEREAVYTFIVTSDDGSRLYIDGKLVVDNDGIHAPQARQGSTRLTKGVHKITVGFMQGGGGAELDVQIEAPGFGHHNLGSLVAVSEAALERKRPVTKDEDSLDVQPALVEKGRTLFASSGCASCHQMNEGKGAIASTLSTPPLNKLKGDGGCLAATATKGLPAYSLSATQRTALSASIKNPPAPPKTPAAMIARTLITFNCYACHVRDKL
ncbi:MAG TPA: c-type cytochrome, partial [Gemmataceae bacterium]|nr:c-type cytochrome [Gemmataceae bacterium]